MFRSCLVLLFIYLSFKGYSQDPQFSQYYNAPLYLNPAFAGTAENTRLVANHRIQWPGIASITPYTTTAFSFDHNIEPIKSGVGVLITRDRQGVGKLTSTDFSLIYSYQVDINKNWSFRPALQASVVSRSIDYSELIYVDQLSNSGLTGAPTSDNIASDNRNLIYPDFATGGLLFSNKFWGGISIHHLNRPNQSYALPLYKLPWKTSIQAGMRLPFGNQSVKKGHSTIDVERSILPSINFKKQGKSSQLDAGVQMIYDPLMFGIWYRGIPIKSFEGNVSNEAIILLAGLHFKRFTLGYSYDITISNLALSNTAGTHEIALIYEWEKYYPSKKKGRALPCPKFYNKQRRTELR